MKVHRASFLGALTRCQVPFCGTWNMPPTQSYSRTSFTKWNASFIWLNGKGSVGACISTTKSDHLRLNSTNRISVEPLYLLSPDDDLQVHLSDAVKKFFSCGGLSITFSFDEAWTSSLQLEALYLQIVCPAYLDVCNGQCIFYTLSAHQNELTSVCLHRIFEIKSSCFHRLLNPTAAQCSNM